MATTSNRPLPDRGNANLASILTWIVPGAGHVYLGAPIFGLVAFLVIQGVYLVGIRLSDGMAFEFLQYDLRSTYAGVLTPEVGNLSGLIWHMNEYGFGPANPRPWPAHIHLGAWLTALSGVLNACLMTKAHMDARIPVGRMRTKLDPGLLVLAGWIVPGLGHWLQGRRMRGTIVFVLLVGLFLIALQLGHGGTLDRERHFYYWGGQFMLGAPAWIAEALHGHAHLTGDIAYIDGALAFASVAGLLNVIALLDVFGFAERQTLESLVVVPARPLAQEAAA